jgi:two-component system response regulator PilR (NtrC family)
VLIVDDDPSIRMLCRVNLELDGHRALEAATIDQARAAVSQEPVDVVILDVHVGAGDGLELLSELRRDRPEMPVALLSGTAEIDVVRGARPDAVIGKPFELNELRSTVERLARGRKASL